MTTSDIPFISSLESKGKNDANLESGDRGDRTEEGDVVKSHVELKFYSQGCGRHGSSVVLLRDSLLISGVVSGVYSYPLSHLTETFASSNSISDSLTSKLDINTERKGNTSIPAESDAVNAVSHKNGIRILKKSSLVTALVTSIGVCVDNPVSQKSKNDTGNCAIDTGIKDIIITGSSDKFITIITNNLPSAQPINIKQTTLHTEITISDIRLSGHTAALVALAVHSKTNYTTKQCTSITCRPSHLVSADSNHELLVWNLDKIISSSLLETPSAVGTKAEICEDRNPEQRISIFPHHAMTMALDFLPNSDVSALFVGGTDMKLSIFTYTSPVNPSGGSSRPNETSHLKQHTTDGVKDDSSNRTYQKILVVSGHMDWIRSIAISTFSAEGNLGEVEKGWIQGDLMIATGSQDKYIRLYRISSDTSLLMQTHEISKGPIDFVGSQSSSLSTKSHLLRTQSTLHSLLLHSVLLGHEAWVTSLVFSSPPNRLLSTSSDGTVLVWKPKGDIWTETRMGGGTAFYSGVFWKGFVVAGGHGGSIHLWEEAENWKARVGLSGHTDSVEGIAWCSEGLLSCSADQTTRVWGNWGERRCEIARPQTHGYPLMGVCAIENGFVSAGGEKVVRVFGEGRAEVPALGLSNKCLTSSDANAEVFEPLEERLATTVWPEIEKLYGHGNDVCVVAACDRWVASACRASRADEAHVRFWGSDWKCTPVGGHGLSVTCLAFSWDGRFCLSGSRDRGWQMYGRDDGWKVVGACAKAHSRIIWGCGFSRDGKCFATGSRDCTIKIWKDGREVGCIRGLSGVTAVEFGDVDRYVLAAGFENGEIIIYDFWFVDGRMEWSEKQIPTEITHAGPVKEVRWRGREVASCSEDGSVRIFGVL